MDSGDSARPCPKRAEREGFLAIAAKTIAGVGRFKRVWTTTTLHHTTLHYTTLTTTPTTTTSTTTTTIATSTTTTASATATTTATTLR